MAAVPMIISDLIQQELKRWRHTFDQIDCVSCALQLQHKARGGQPLAARQRCPFVVHGREELPRRAICKNSILILPCYTNFDIFVLAALGAKPGVNRRPAAEPPTAWEIGQKPANGEELVERPARNIHSILHAARQQRDCYGNYGTIGGAVTSSSSVR